MTSTDLLDVQPLQTIDVRRICAYWSNSGSCLKGDHCDFIHIDPTNGVVRGDLAAAGKKLQTPVHFRTKLCKWSNTQCKYYQQDGNKCHYLHLPDGYVEPTAGLQALEAVMPGLKELTGGTKVASAPRTATVLRPMLPNQTPTISVCRFWVRGTCAYGDQCRNLHHQSSPPTSATAIRLGAASGNGMSQDDMVFLPDGLGQLSISGNSPTQPDALLTDSSPGSFVGSTDSSTSGSILAQSMDSSIGGPSGITSRSGSAVSSNSGPSSSRSSVDQSPSPVNGNRHNSLTLALAPNLAQLSPRTTTTTSSNGLNTVNVTVTANINGNGNNSNQQHQQLFGSLGSPQGVVVSPGITSVSISPNINLSSNSGSGGPSNSTAGASGSSPVAVSSPSGSTAGSSTTLVSSPRPGQSNIQQQQPQQQQPSSNQTVLNPISIQLPSGAQQVQQTQGQVPTNVASPKPLAGNGNSNSNGNSSSGSVVPTRLAMPTSAYAQQARAPVSAVQPVVAVVQPVVVPAGLAPQHQQQWQALESKLASLSAQQLQIQAQQRRLQMQAQARQRWMAAQGTQAQGQGQGTLAVASTTTVTSFASSSTHIIAEMPDAAPDAILRVTPSSVVAPVVTNPGCVCGNFADLGEICSKCFLDKATETE